MHFYLVPYFKRHSRTNSNIDRLSWSIHKDSALYRKENSSISLTASSHLNGVENQWWSRKQLSLVSIKKKKSWHWGWRQQDEPRIVWYDCAYGIQVRFEVGAENIEMTFRLIVRIAALYEISDKEYGDIPSDLYLAAYSYEKANWIWSFQLQLFWWVFNNFSQRI